MSRESVLVAHPFLQHSHRFAAALYHGGLLQKYISGTPLKGTEKDQGDWIGNHLRKARTISIPSNLRQNTLWTHILKLGCAALSGEKKHDCHHRIFHLFDYWCSLQVARLRPSVVVAFENSAYWTFKRAKEVGAICVLDAPSVHYSIADKIVNLKTTPYRKEINRRKDQEIELADFIITCSEFAKATYVQVGIESRKISPILLGGTTPVDELRLDSTDGMIRFVFAGGITKRKSVDLILDAFEILCRTHSNVELALVGGCDDEELLGRMANLNRVKWLGKKAQGDLFEIFKKSDCLLLPSRFDSFGMVVAEAMACGIPAIVSHYTGAKEIIEMHPKSGKIVDLEKNSIAEAMAHYVDDLSSLQTAKRAAHEASKEFTWDAYSDRIIKLFTALGGRNA